MLEDGVLRVPLWAKYPEGAKPLRQAGPYISLTQIPEIVRYVAYGGPN